MNTYHNNHDIQGVENVSITNFGSNKVSEADKATGITSAIPFDAKFSILLRSANGVPHDTTIHMEFLTLANGERKIRTVAMPDDAAYTAQLQLFEPWDCEVSANE